MKLSYTGRRTLKRATLVVLPTILLLLISSSSHIADFQDASSLKSGTVNEKPRSETSTGATGSSAELTQRIEQLIEQSGFTSARWGVCLISQNDGLVLTRVNGDKLFAPASNMKIYTTAVALDLLGADYRWRTSVYADRQATSSGSIQGDLILYGRGAPDLVSHDKVEGKASLAKLADNLYQRGIRSVEGNVIGDESYFRGNPWGDGWQWTDIQWYFGAEASALSVNGNEIDVNLIPSAKTAEPPTVKSSDSLGYVTVHNRMKTVDSNVRATIGLHRGLSDNNIQVWGEFGPNTRGFGARLSVHNPALWAANLFLDALKHRGIIVAGHAEARNSRVPPSQRFDPSRAVELTNVTSQPLSDIVRRTNKQSDNLYAELILRTLGRERGELVSQPEPVGRERGDDESGLAVMRLWLTRAGIGTNGLALHDGSGLSRLNLVTPESAARLLVAISKTASGGAFKESLPIAGKDGTLAGRLKSVDGRIVAKTGYLTYNNSLSGYLTTSDGKLLAFSIMCNDQTIRGDSGRLIDKIATLLADYPDFRGQNETKSFENP